MFERIRQYIETIKELRQSMRGIEIIGPAEKNSLDQSPKPEDDLIHFSWNITERTKKQRGIFWYMIAIGFIGLLAIYGIWAQNFLLAIMCVMIVAIYIVQMQRGELNLNFKITGKGVWRGPYLYPYKELKAFWLYYDPPIKTLYIEFRSMLKPRLSIPLGDQNPIKVRDTLALYLPENTRREEESLSDKLERGLKL